MRFYFHVTSALGPIFDTDGIEFPTFVAALHKADEFSQELGREPIACDLPEAAIQVVSASGLFSYSVPIPTGCSADRQLH
jgi:hypothetical protein